MLQCRCFSKWIKGPTPRPYKVHNKISLQQYSILLNWSKNFENGGIMKELVVFSESHTQSTWRSANRPTYHHIMCRGRRAPVCRCIVSPYDHTIVITIYNPFLDHLINDLETRFSAHSQTAMTISRLLPSRVADTNDSDKFRRHNHALRINSTVSSPVSDLEKKSSSKHGKISGKKSLI